MVSPTIEFELFVVIEVLDYHLGLVCTRGLTIIFSLIFAPISDSINLRFTIGPALFRSVDPVDSGMRVNDLQRD